MENNKFKVSALFAVTLLSALSVFAAEEETYINLGIGGGGGFSAPAWGDRAGNLLFVCSDKGSVFASRDGGTRWQIVPSEELFGAQHCGILVDPSNEKTLYTADGQGLKTSLDSGRTWKILGEEEAPWKSETITHLGIETAAKKMMYAGTTNGLYRSDDKGKRWKRIGTFSGPCAGIVPLATHTYVAYGNSVYETIDGGSSWEQKRVAPVDGRVTSLAGGYKKGSSRMVMFAAVSGVGVAGSENWCKSWSTLLKEPGVGLVTMASEQDKVAFAASEDTVWRTDDGGATWKECFKANQEAVSANVRASWVHSELGRGCKIATNGMAVQPKAAFVMLCTDGELYVTRNSGANWSSAMNTCTGPISGQKGNFYSSIGLEANSPWEYYIDPRKRLNTYIAYSEAGLCRSFDKGATWAAAVKNEAAPTFYCILFDPFIEGRIYAATGAQSRIPDWREMDRVEEGGGVLLSEDSGQTWRPISKGLPNKPVTYLTVDPKSTKGAVTLYAAVYGDGVYKSTDSGESWTRRSSGLGRQGNNNVFMVKAHPKTGEIFCSMTGAGKGDGPIIPGGLWVSQDAGDSWSEISTKLDLCWPTGFDFDPRNSTILYLAACSAGKKEQGGLYRTDTTGKMWTHVLKETDFQADGEREGVQAWFVSVSGHNADHVYLSTIDHGLWVSTDTGMSWARLEWVPTRAITRICFPPLDKGAIYVSTWGAGVWKGPAVPQK